jgi:hypothetical protein
MHLPAFVALRRARQGLSRFEGKIFGQANFHDGRFPIVEFRWF